MFLKITCDFPAVIYMQIFLNLLFTLYALKLRPESCNSWPGKRRVSQAPLYTVPIWCSVFWSAEIIAGNTCALLSRYYSNCSRITTRYRNGIPFINSPPDVFTAMYFITFFKRSLKCWVTPLCSFIHLHVIFAVNLILGSQDEKKLFNKFY